LSMGSLMGCSFSSDYFLPSLNAEEPSGRTLVNRIKLTHLTKNR
jgi:hypothetical protein